MNKRQKKKNFKKKHGYNPPRESKMDFKSFDNFLFDLKEAMTDAARMIVSAFDEIKKITNENLKKIRDMSDDEFELFCEKLTLEQEVAARKIRGK